MYKYFVSFMASIKPRVPGQPSIKGQMGNIGLTLDSPVESIEDIDKFVDIITRENTRLRNVIVLNYKRF